VNNKPVLYAEDEADDVLFMQHAWSKASVPNRLHVVTDGEQAVQYLSGEGKNANRHEHPLPGLVLLDLKLPKLSGLDVLKWVRQQRATRALPVMVLSSSTNPADVSAAYELRANAYLVKPSQAEDLVGLIANLKDFWLARVEAPAE